MKQKIDYWNQPALIAPTNFKNKSLACWAYNVAMGCGHGCRFCYVPEISAQKFKTELATHQIKDPDAEWGDYVLVRHWDEKAFRASLRKAERTPLEKLNKDGHRAVFFCSTTDPYQKIRHPEQNKRAILQAELDACVRGALKIILEESTLNVRILTRSHRAVMDLELLKKFRNRIMFGMSLPTLRREWTDFYEPHASSPEERFKTLQIMRDAGVPIYVAMAPTYPECDRADIIKTLTAIKILNPLTIFHEPINIRAKNFTRIAKAAQRQGFQNQPVTAGDSWRAYAMAQFGMVWDAAADLGITGKLHLWPDTALEQYTPKEWIKARWARISEWPE